MLPFDAEGKAIDNYHQNAGARHALLFGHGNAYYVGKYNSQTFDFVAAGAKNGSRREERVGAAVNKRGARVPPTLQQFPPGGTMQW